MGSFVGCLSTKNEQNGGFNGLKVLEMIFKFYFLIFFFLFFFFFFVFSFCFIKTTFTFWIGTSTIMTDTTGRIIIIVVMGDGEAGENGL